METLHTQIENIVSVMGCIIDEWSRGGESCTKEEFEQLYIDVTDVLTRVEDLENAIGIIKGTIEI